MDNTATAIRDYSMEQFCDFASTELKAINDIPLLILKGHILVEYTLNCYLESLSNSKDSDFFRENFSFAEKIKIVKYFGKKLGNNDENLIKELILLNKLRNDIAHSLTYNPKHLDEICFEVNKKTSSQIFAKESEIKHRLISVVSFLCGAIFAAYKTFTNPIELSSFLKTKE